MSEHTHPLHQGKRVACPKCEARRGFAPVLGYPFEAGYGHCFSCGWYHYPDERGSGGGEGVKNVKLPTRVRKALPPPAIVPPDVLRKSASPAHYGANPFARWLRELVGHAAADELLGRYLVGTSKQTREGVQGTVFWFVDCKGQARASKITWYDADTGRRRKDAGMSWGHGSGKGYRPCLFGEHLLAARPTAPALVLESEKSAVLCAHRFPELVPVSVGGAANLRAVNYWRENAAALKGRRVLVVPDNDRAGMEAAAEGLKILRGNSLSAELVFLDGNQLPDGYDLADVVADAIRQGGSVAPTREAIPPPPPETGPERILREMTAAHPQLTELVRAFDCLPVSGA